MKLLIDGDLIQYQAAYSKDATTVTGVIEKVDSILNDILYNCSQYNRQNEYTIYLTGSGNFRHQIAGDYKANRPKEKPQTLALARQWLIDQWGAVVVDGQEADDAIAQEATRVGYGDVIIVSIDKDFKQLPCLIYNFRKNTWLKIDELGAKYNFWTQVLTGDNVDNIKGLVGIGPVKAKKILQDCTTEDDMYRETLKAYDNDKEALTKTAQLVYLRKKEGEEWVVPTTA